ncbi:hypothetical protein CcaCcLH18_10408 [Colletotrichum camelliae]|nr:hypothetical protein CcaCcLH18_10408 [Colletotrichum camelliae]
MPAERAQGHGAHLVAILLAVFYFKFGQTLIDKPIEILFREIICNSHYNHPSKNLIRAFPYDDPLCQIEEIENIIERGKAISLVLEAVGGLLAAYVVLRANYRERQVLFGSLIWIVAKILIYFTTHERWHMLLYWVFSGLAGSGRVVVEGAILGMLTDLSDEQNRARNLSYMFSMALFSYIAANVAFKPLVEYSVDVSYIAAMTGITLGVTTIAICRVLYFKTYCRQAESYPSEEEANTDRRSPRVQVFSSLARFPSCFLLFIAAALPPMASFSMSSLATWISRVFTVYKTLLDLPTPLYLFPSTALLVTGTMIPILESGRARRYSTNPQRRAYSLLSVSLLSISIGTLLVVSSKDGNYKCLIGGLVFMGLGGGAVPLTLAMLVSHLGSRLRCGHVGRAFGAIYTLQCVVSLVLGPVLYTLRKPGRPAMAQLFSQLIVLLAVQTAFCATLSWWFKDLASTAQSRERDVELEEMRREAAPHVAPSAPPPAYSPLARQNGRV